MRKGASGWAGVAMTLSGISIQSLLPHAIGWSFVIFLAANILWFANGALHGNRPQMAVQAVSAALNLHAIWIWR